MIESSDVANQPVNNPLLVDVFKSQSQSTSILSLDCFDTILFRNSLMPRDAFYDLATYKTHKELNCSAFVRIKIEKEAYKYNQLFSSTEQVTLEEIYRLAYTAISNEALEALIEEEIECELKTLYASKEAIDLINEAKKQHKKIIVVSDTYFSSDQLNRILAALLPAETYQAIDRVYTSAEKRVGKTKGLFQLILKEHAIKASNMLHIGDNVRADYDVPQTLGINAHRLISHQDGLSEMMRTFPLVAKMLDPTIRHDRGLNFFCKELASQFDRHDGIEGTAACIAMILFSFSQFLQKEISEFTKDNKNLKVAFLLRDAHLPFCVDQIINQSDAKLVRVSRFSSFAASFRSKESIVKYLATRVGSGKFKEMLKQLLVPEDLQLKILRKTLESKNKKNMFTNLVLKDAVIKRIVEASKRYSDRLYRYLQSELNLQSGETLMFVDLGYTGTAQICLEPIYRDEHGIEIVGRYLVSLASAGSQSSHKGLIDCADYDDKALVAVVTYISLFEQICTAVDRSVIDFDEDGKPIYSDQTTDSAQKNQVKQLQDLVLDFTRAMQNTSIKQQLPQSDQAYRDVALFHLARLVYCPTVNEIEYFLAFNHDVNLGTDDFHRLYDVAKGWDGLAGVGWLNSLNVKSKQQRMNYPTEWRVFDLSLTTTLLNQYMSDFSLTKSDVTKRKLKMDVLIKSQEGSNLVPIQAQHTYDGIFRLTIPVVPGVHLGVCIGKRLSQFELHAVSLESIGSSDTEEGIKPVESGMIFDQVQLISSNIYECQDEAGMLIYAPDDAQKTTQLLHINFRPLGGLLFDLE